jgi:ElaB/YqjD/DUF883 family membrane-anchored ribosome-binding protein
MTHRRTLSRIPIHPAVEGNATPELPRSCRAASGYNGSPVVPRFHCNSLEAAMSIEQTRDQIVDQFSSVLSEAESLLNKATHETGEKARDLRSQAEARLLSAKLKLQELQGAAVDRAKDAARVTDDYVHENPWQAVGIAAAVGLVAGLLMNRR